VTIFTRWLNFSKITKDSYVTEPTCDFQRLGRTQQQRSFWSESLCNCIKVLQLWVSFSAVYFIHICLWIDNRVQRRL